MRSPGQPAIGAVASQNFQTKKSQPSALPLAGFYYVAFSYVASPD
jgi:hypothetical protein